VLGSFGEAAGEPRSWRSPIDRLEFVYEHGGMHFRSERESHRRALRARESWPELAMLFVKQRGPEWEFQVKLCYEGIDEEGESVHEHLWFTLDEIKGDQLRATLFSSPRFIPALTAGQSGWHSVERLSDWTAHTPAGTFGPARAHELAEQFGGGAPVDNCSAEAAAPGELPPGFRWPFPDPPNAAALTMKSVVREGKPVLYVSHDDDDGTWQFLAGSDEPRTEDAMVVGLGEMIARDHGLLALADLPCGWIAWRTAPGQPWRRGRHP